MGYECRVLSESDVLRLLTWDDAISSQRRAFTALAAGRTQLPDKVGVRGGDDALLLNYTARLSLDAPPVAKLVSVNPLNSRLGLPLIHGVITVLDPVTGRVVAIIDGTSVTTRRTAAASALVADVLAQPSLARIVIIGTGVQAQAHAAAICRVRDPELITIVGRRREPTTDLARLLSSTLDREVQASTSAASCVPGAGLVLLCTNSHTPVLDHGWLSPGTTVISVGSFEPDRCEVQRLTVSRADLVVVDHLPTSLQHAGPIIRAVQTGGLPLEAVVEFGSILTGAHPGRQRPEELIFVNSVGIGVQDAAAAEFLVDAAMRTGFGQRIQL